VNCAANLAFWHFAGGIVYKLSFEKLGRVQIQGELRCAQIGKKSQIIVIGAALGSFTRCV
jgi:hypothetical protein